MFLSIRMCVYAREKVSRESRMENSRYPYLWRRTRHFVLTCLHETEYTLLKRVENDARSSQKGFATTPATTSASSAVFFRVVGSNNVCFLVLVNVVVYVVVDTDIERRKERFSRQRRGEEEFRERKRGSGIVRVHVRAENEERKFSARRV